MSETLQYQQLSDALSRLGYTQDAAEYHGALCGALCVRPPREIDPLQVLERDAPAGSPEAEQTLRQLCGQSAEALSSLELAFGPMLPDDAEALPVRVRALSSWCGGFLYGLATGRPLNMKACSAEFKEILRDFTEFMRADMDEGEDAEIEENAYAELVEYIRVGAQLVYLELQESSPRNPAARTMH